MAELEQIAKTLSPVRRRLLTDMAASLRGDLPDTYRDPASDFADPVFCEYFGCRLRIHHATLADKFKKEACRPDKVDSEQIQVPSE
ncbi:MAG: hypothetical protein GY898_17710 [Proteobacteria bacterium]|nr:hypothetical protein [Pseudomonadota bacterium]